MPLGVKLEFGIDGLCRSLIRKMGLCLFVLNPGGVCSADAACVVTLHQQHFFRV